MTEGSAIPRIPTPIVLDSRLDFSAYRLIPASAVSICELTVDLFRHCPLVTEHDLGGGLSWGRPLLVLIFSSPCVQESRMTSPVNPPAPATTTPPNPPRPRHRGEFWAVRIGIFVLVALAAVQAHARFGYEMSLKKLHERVSAEEASGEPLLVSDLSGYIVGFPSKSVHEERHWRQITYRWSGLTENYEIHLPFDSSESAPVVLSLMTANPPADEPQKPLPTAGEATPVPQMGMMMGGGAPGGPGGRRRFDLMASDKDEDGKVSREEAPERVAASFGEWDTNSDGLIDAEEIAARRARRQAEGGGGPGGGARPAGEAGAE